MSLWRQLTHGLRGLMRQREKNQEADDELQHYFEEAVALSKSRGLSDEDAEQAARLELGNITVAQEQVRSYGWENAVRTFSFDVRFAARQLRNHPGFTIVGILTLALGIGASTAIFSAVNPILFKPLPYPHSDRILRYAVSTDYCQTMSIHLLRGRCLDQRDTAAAPQAALISESLAKSHFGFQNPLGKRLHVGPRDRPWYTVVGVVGDVKQTSLAINQPDAVYLSTQQTWFADDTLSFVIRARDNAADLAPAVKNAIWSVDRNQPIVRVMTMDRMMAITEAERRFVLILFETFGLVALMLAAVGIYGVLSGNVAERTREIGLRAALGASRRDILALILRDGMRLTAFGIAIGLCGAIAAAQAMTTLLFGTSPLDPIAWTAVVLTLVGVSAIACWAPAWRASRVDPSITLRAE